jgi:hypothetical protein
MLNAIDSVSESGVARIFFFSFTRDSQNLGLGG